MWQGTAVRPPPVLAAAAFVGFRDRGLGAALETREATSVSRRCQGLRGGLRTFCRSGREHRDVVRRLGQFCLTAHPSCPLLEGPG